MLQINPESEHLAAGDGRKPAHSEHPGPVRRLPDLRMLQIYGAGAVLAEPCDIPRGTIRAPIPNPASKPPR